MEPVTLLIQFDDLPNDTKYVMTTFLALFSVFLVLLIVYVLLLICTLLYSFIKAEKCEIEYTRLHE